MTSWIFPRIYPTPTPPRVTSETPSAFPFAPDELQTLHATWVTGIPLRGPWGMSSRPFPDISPPFPSTDFCDKVLCQVRAKNAKKRPIHVADTAARPPRKGDLTHDVVDTCHQVSTTPQNLPYTISM